VAHFHKTAFAHARAKAAWPLASLLWRCAKRWRRPYKDCHTLTEACKPTFVDLFAGCGGLSLGLCQAGFHGLFAIEKAEHAFKTFRTNFLEQGPAEFRFTWPHDLLAVSPHGIEDLLEGPGRQRRLEALRGKVDLVAGGPPCQGFSFSGRRNRDDPRNRLFEQYVKFVNLVLPRVIVLENVPGMLVDHESGQRSLRGEYRPSPFFKKFKESLERNFFVHERRLNAVDFGVPQRRERLIVLGIRRGPEWGDEREAPRRLAQAMADLLVHIEREGAHQLRKLLDPDLGRGGSSSQLLSVRAAISDMEVGHWRPGQEPPYARVVNWTKHCDGDGDDAELRVPGKYWRLAYKGPLTKYQRAMHRKLPGERMTSLRLARHSATVQERFDEILRDRTIVKGMPLTKEVRERLGLQKHRTFPLHASLPAPTLTTLPDDLVHYSEPRILTVREYARLQSFPDWFRFRGKYTTGGHLRKSESPRYTQIGNAVPPLLARALGVGLASLLQSWPSNAPGATRSKALEPDALPTMA
jgi:DNA (cytosine-5)-methyltransferase 1